MVSFLVRGAVPEGLTGKDAALAAEAITRADVLESELAGFTTNGTVACRWAQIFKVRKTADNPERNLKLTAESLFLALSDPVNERSVENERLLQVLAIMLERKRVLRPKGRSGGGANARQIYEHAKMKTLHEVQAAELSPEFFLSIQEQLAALVGRGGSAAAGNTGADDAVADEGEARG